jgi:hypothetical protein
VFSEGCGHEEPVPILHVGGKGISGFDAPSDLSESFANGANFEG